MMGNNGLSLFMTKNAEAEPWLVPHAFVPLPDFASFKGLNSIIIYSRLGAGKTTTSLALAEFARAELKCLPLRWTPNLPPSPPPPSTELAMDQFSTILSAVAHEILHRHGQEFKKRLKESRNLDYLIEFLDHFIPPGDRDLLQKTVPAPKSHLIQRDTKPDIIATELIKNLSHLEYPGGIWILVDGLDWRSDAEKQSAINILRSILSTLPLFEINGLHFKMLLPLELEGELGDISAKVKERVSAHRLSWETKHLRGMIEKRLRLALDEGDILADQIYPEKELFGWLEACGGLSPRGWLEYFRPIFATVWENYQSDGVRRLTREEWDAARKRSSLQLRFYPEKKQVVIGMNSPRILPPEELAIFTYLYENRGKYCSKQDIFNKAYLPFNARGKGMKPGSTGEFPKEFDNLVNTAISRLRKSIEPLPKDPVFLTMKKNLGYRLSLQAFAEE